MKSSEEMHFPSYGLVLDDPGIDPKKVQTGLQALAMTVRSPEGSTKYARSQTAPTREDSVC
jgi:hypothetical protein